MTLKKMINNIINKCNTFNWSSIVRIRLIIKATCVKHWWSMAKKISLLDYFIYATIGENSDIFMQSLTFDKASRILYHFKKLKSRSILWVSKLFIKNTILSLSLSFSLPTRIKIVKYKNGLLLPKRAVILILTGTVRSQLRLANINPYRLLIERKKNCIPII